MGLGHLIRSAALAEMLRDDFCCVLARRHLPDALLPEMERVYDQLMDLRSVEEGLPEAEYLAEFARMPDPHGINPVVILDGYHFRTDYQHVLKEAGLKLVCIDDIHAYRFEADVVINHAPIEGLAQQYDLSDQTTLLTGLSYSLLRPAFLSAARKRQTRSPAGEKRYYICFGGSDFNNISGQLIGWLTDAGCSVPLDVVLGAANNHQPTVAQAAAAYPASVTIHQDLGEEEMIELLKKAFLAFLPASTTMIEGLTVGVPVVGGYYVDNQIAIYGGLVKKGLIHGIGNWNAPVGLAKVVARLSLPAAPTRTPVGHYLDGYARVNFTQLFRQLIRGEELLIARPALPEDVETYFRWVNDTEVRKNALQSEPITWKIHQGWFTDRLAEPTSLLLLFSVLNQPCGQVRFDSGGHSAFIDISLDQEFRGRGFGSRMLYLAEEQLRLRKPGITQVIAWVKINNTASVRLFEKSGYKKTNNFIQQNKELFTFHKILNHSL